MREWERTREILLPPLKVKYNPLDQSDSIPTLDVVSRKQRRLRSMKFIDELWLDYTFVPKGWNMLGMLKIEKVWNASKLKENETNKQLEIDR